MLAIQISLNEAQLRAGIENGIRLAGASSGVRCNSLSRPGEDGKVRASVMVKVARSKEASIDLPHDAVIAAIAASQASKGVVIDPSSLKFSYTESRGYGGGSSVNATANTATQFTPPVSGPGVLVFASPAIVSFNEAETVAVLESWAERQGAKADRARLGQSDGGKFSATIYLKLNNGQTGNSTLDHTGLMAALEEEFVAQGFAVVPGGIRLNYTPGRGFGGGAFYTCYVEVKSMLVNQ